MSPSICLGFPHAPWLPGRVDAVKRLMSSLFPYEGTFIPMASIEDRCKPHEWARMVWGWQLYTGCDFCLTLADDSIVSPRFWQSLKGMIQTLPPHALLGLAAQHPRGPEVYKESRWYRTRSWVVGWGYGMWTSDLAEFVHWFDAKSTPWKEAHADDNSINEWASETGRDVWHPLPTIVDHDVTIASSWLPEPDVTNCSSYTWEDHGGVPGPLFWETTREPPMLEMPSEEVRKGLKEGYWR